MDFFKRIIHGTEEEDCYGEIRFKNGYKIGIGWNERLYRCEVKSLFCNPIEPENYNSFEICFFDENGRYLTVDELLKENNDLDKNLYIGLKEKEFSEPWYWNFIAYEMVHDIIIQCIVCDFTKVFGE